MKVVYFHEQLVIATVASTVKVSFIGKSKQLQKISSTEKRMLMVLPILKENYVSKDIYLLNSWAFPICCVDWNQKFPWEIRICTTAHSTVKVPKRMETLRRIPLFPFQPKRSEIIALFTNSIVTNPVHHGQILRTSTFSRVCDNCRVIFVSRMFWTNGKSLTNFQIWT